MSGFIKRNRALVEGVFGSAIAAAGLFILFLGMASCQRVADGATWFVNAPMTTVGSNIVSAPTYQAVADLLFGTTISNSTAVTTNADLYGNTTNNALLANRLMRTGADKVQYSVSNLTVFIAGTANETSIDDDGDGTVTVRTAQPIGASSAVTFGTITAGAVAFGNVGSSDTVTATNVIASTLTSGYLTRAGPNGQLTNSIAFQTADGIGVGTTTPVAPLTVKSATATGAGIDVVGRVDSYGFLQFFQADGTTLNGAIYGHTNQITITDTAGTDVLTVTNGSVGIKTTVPTAELSVNGTITAAALTLTNALTVPNGGSGAATFTDGGVLVGNGTGAFSVTTAGAAGQVLISGGAGVDPAFAALPSHTHGASDVISGTITVARGGTGVSTLADAGVLIGNGTGAVNVTGAGTAGQVLTSNGAGVDPTFAALPLFRKLKYINTVEGLTNSTGFTTIVPTSGSGSLTFAGGDLAAGRGFVVQLTGAGTGTGSETAELKVTFGTRTITFTGLTQPGYSLGWWIEVYVNVISTDTVVLKGRYTDGVTRQFQQSVGAETISGSLSLDAQAKVSAGTSYITLQTFLVETFGI